MSDGTDLYRRMLEFNYGAGETNEMMRNHWAGTPWMVEAFTGSHIEGREREMLVWCNEQFGPEAWPYTTNPRPGRWKRGGATVFGWAWFGFDTEEAMNAFVEAWPYTADQPASES